MMSTFCSFGQNMTNKKIDAILQKHAIHLEGNEGGWEAVIDQRPILIVSDDAANRLRIFTYVVEFEKLGKGEMEMLLRANFQSALDAKYAIYEGLVISVFTHPFNELTPEHFINALHQVNNLAENFGTSYSSTQFVFGLGDDASPKSNMRINVRPGKGEVRN